MATINQLRVERNAYFRELKRSLKPVDSAIEKVERRINRILDRRLNVPESEDYSKVVEEAKAVADALESFSTQLDLGLPIFGGR